MSDERFFEGRWYMEPATGGWAWLEPGYYDPVLRPEPSVFLQHEQVRVLIAALDKAGWIQPRLDERLRTEDLKITHRLLDLLELRRNSD